MNKRWNVFNVNIPYVRLNTFSFNGINTASFILYNYKDYFRLKKCIFKIKIVSTF